MNKGFNLHSQDLYFQNESVGIINYDMSIRDSKNCYVALHQCIVGGNII